jgi:hypothetical protein
MTRDFTIVGNSVDFMEAPAARLNHIWRDRTEDFQAASTVTTMVAGGNGRSAIGRTEVSKSGGANEHVSQSFVASRRRQDGATNRPCLSADHRRRL